MVKTERIKSEINSTSHIDIEQLKEATARLGPLSLSNPSTPYEVRLAVYKCVCNTEDCQNLVVAVWRCNGLLTRHWLLTPEDLLSYETLEIFLFAVTFGELYDPRGEILLAERAIYDEFGKKYDEITEPFCICPECSDATSKEHLAKKTLLREMVFGLNERDQLLSHAREKSGSDVEELVRRAFDVGFNLARNLGELQAKIYVEPDAMKAQTIIAAASAGGAARAANAKSHRDSVLEEMTRLIGEGKSVSSAARIAANRGIGKSQGANRKAWNRHKSGT